MKKRGRPSIGEDQRTADVHLTLRPQEYDDAYRLASRQRVSIQVVIRRALVRLIDDERGEFQAT